MKIKIKIQPTWMKRISTMKINVQSNELNKIKNSSGESFVLEFKLKIRIGLIIVRNKILKRKINIRLNKFY